MDMIDSFESVAVVVSDAQKSLKWYSDKLGFAAASSEGHWVTVRPKGSSTLLHLCESKKTEPGNTGILFVVDDVDRTYSELSSKGVSFTKPPRDDGWGKYAIFTDPDGNEFWIQAGE